MLGSLLIKGFTMLHNGFHTILEVKKRLLMYVHSYLLYFSLTNNKWIGQDASVAFEERGHSTKARELLEDFKIGITEENRRYEATKNIP
jgi:hypothetical protein